MPLVAVCNNDRARILPKSNCLPRMTQAAAKIRIFVSSVQKELERERAAITALVSTDPFFEKHCDAILYDKEPPTGSPDKKAYLDLLRSCHIYLLLIDVEYGKPSGDVSATHEEYRLAQELKLPTLVFIKGADSKKDAAREKKTKEFIEETKRDGYKYVRFHDREDLRPGVRDALLALLKNKFQITASAGEAEEGEHLIEVASPFEAAPLGDVGVTSLNADLLADFVEHVIEKPAMRIWDDAPGRALVMRGLAIQRPGAAAVVTHAAFLLFGTRPADRFPQCEILADAYDDIRVSGRPKGQETIGDSILAAIPKALAFVDQHTFHPHRVVRLNNIRLNEYPDRALREALVNALAHRNYEDATRKISLRVFKDRIEVASPGYPLKPLTLAKLRAGRYRPCSRNPLIAQTLASFGLMEQRGTGFARMRDAMLDHGLDTPAFTEQDGYFIVTFPGPNGNYDRLKVSTGAAGLVTPAVEAQLNDRQKKIMLEVQQRGSITSGWCRNAFRVSYNTAFRDLSDLVQRGLLLQVGKGRATHYQIKPPVS
jgi:ATP-dependent DNA helicase RecG